MHRKYMNSTSKPLNNTFSFHNLWRSNHTRCIAPLRIQHRTIGRHSGQRLQLPIRNILQRHRRTPPTGVPGQICRLNGHNIHHRDVRPVHHALNRGRKLAYAGPTVDQDLGLVWGRIRSRCVLEIVSVVAVVRVRIVIVVIRFVVVLFLVFVLYDVVFVELVELLSWLPLPPLPFSSIWKNEITKLKLNHKEELIIGESERLWRGSGGGFWIIGGNYLNGRKGRLALKEMEKQRVKCGVSDWWENWIKWRAIQERE